MKQTEAQKKALQKYLNSEKGKETKKKYYIENRHLIIARGKEWAKKNKHRVRGYTLKHMYGITQEEYNDFLIKQNGVCAICLRRETKIDVRNGKLRDLCVDHCHATGKIRGLLCDDCNLGLGKFRDDKLLLNKAFLYLCQTN